MKRLKKLAAKLPNSSKLSSKHILTIKGGAGNAQAGDAYGSDHDKRPA